MCFWFFLKTSYNIYCMSSRATIPEYLSLGERKSLKCYMYVALCLRHRATKHSRSFLSAQGKLVGMLHSKPWTLYTYLLAIGTVASSLFPKLQLFHEVKKSKILAVEGAINLLHVTSKESINTPKKILFVGNAEFLNHFKCNYKCKVYAASM